MFPDLIVRLFNLAYNIYYSLIVLFDQERTMSLDRTNSNSRITLFRIVTPILIKKAIDQNMFYPPAPFLWTGAFY